MRILFIWVLALTTITSCICGGDDCDDLNTNIEEHCPDLFITSQSQLDSLTPGNFSLESFRIDHIDQNVKLEISLSGCSFSREYNLFVSEAKAKSLPPQQDAKLVFEEQACDAVFNGVICFDYSKLERPTVLKLQTSTGIESILID